MILAGYFLGRAFPDIQKKLEYVVILIILIILFLFFFEFIPLIIAALIAIASEVSLLAMADIAAVDI